MDYISHYNSPLGGITLASDGEALTGLWFDGQKFFGDTLQPQGGGSACISGDPQVAGHLFQRQGSGIYSETLPAGHPVPQSSMGDSAHHPFR